MIHALAEAGRSTRTAAEETDDMNEKHSQYEDYTMGLALFDLVPVLLFLMSGLVIWSISGSGLFLAGALCSFLAGLSKAVWKIIVVKSGCDIGLLTKLFRVMMPAGFALMLIAAIAAAAAESRNGIPSGGFGISGGLRAAASVPAVLFFAAGTAGMCLMGWLGSHLDSSAGSAWKEEVLNAISQLLILAGVITVYFGLFYHADAHALSAMKSTDSVEVTQTGRVVLFDGEGEEDALVFYPGGKVEAAAYAPLMMKIAENGTDCFLCGMPLNFALIDSDAAEDIREEYGRIYTHWYAGGHSLGGVAASMLTSGGTDWDGLILLASYPADEQRIPVLSVYGSEDKVLNFESYSKAYDKGRFPEDTAEQVIPGGNHAGFGSYGAQKGDGAAKISSEEQQTETAGIISGFVR